MSIYKMWSTKHLFYSVKHSEVLNLCNLQLIHSQMGEAWSNSQLWLWFLVPITMWYNDQFIMGSNCIFFKRFQSSTCCRGPIWEPFVCLQLALRFIKAKIRIGTYWTHTIGGMLLYENISLLEVEILNEHFPISWSWVILAR